MSREVLQEICLSARDKILALLSHEVRSWWRNRLAASKHESIRELDMGASFGHEKSLRLCIGRNTSIANSSALLSREVVSALIFAMASAQAVKTTRAVLPSPTPTIQTSRLLLRPYKKEDLADFFELRSQFEVMQWTSTGKVDADQTFTQKWMDSVLPPNDAGTLTFAIEELSNPGKVVGACGTLPRGEPPSIG